MLEYDSIDISEGIDINKTMHQKNVIFWYFEDIGFKCEPYLCNGCYSLMQKAMNLNYVATVSVKVNDYRIHFWYMSKDDAISIMNNFSLNEQNGHVVIFFIMYKK